MKWASIKGSLRRESGLGKENSSGATDSIIRGNGETAKRMEAGIGNLSKARAIWDNGKMDKSPAMEFIR